MARIPPTVLHSDRGEQNLQLTVHVPVRTLSCITFTFSHFAGCREHAMVIRLLRIAAACLLFAAPLAAEPPLPDIAHVRARYIAAVTSIHTLDCTMRITWSHTKRHAPKSLADQHVAADLHLWRKLQARALLNETFDGNGQPSMTTWRGFDGTYYADWTKPLKSRDLQPWLPDGHISTTKDNFLYDEFTIDRLTGETLFAADAPLGSLLSTSDARIAGWDDIDGHPCVKVTFPRHLKTRKHANQLVIETTAWLDPNFTFLPRKIEWRDFSDGSGALPRLSSQTTTAFRRCDGEDKRGYIIPSAGLRTTPLVTGSVEVQDVVINGVISDDRFQPEFPPFTEVTESLPGKSPRVRIVGNPQQRRELLQKINDATKIRLPNDRKSTGTMSQPTTINPPSPPSAAPQDADRMSTKRLTWVVIGSAICLSAILLGWLALKPRN